MNNRIAPNPLLNELMQAQDRIDLERNWTERQLASQRISETQEAIGRDRLIFIEDDIRIINPPPLTDEEIIVASRQRLEEAILRNYARNAMERAGNLHAFEMTEEQFAELTKEPEKPKAQFNKATFIHSLSPSNELLAILEPLTDKAAILKAVFEYNNRPALPVKTFKPSRRALRCIAEYNSGIKDVYLVRLEEFYDQCRSRVGEPEELDGYVDNQERIEMGVEIGVDILNHPLFVVNSIKKHERDRRTYMRICTKDDVYFTFEGNRLNFGKFTFVINLSNGAIGFVQRKENFTQYAGPYLSQNSVCLGDNSHSVTHAIRNGRLFEAMTELYTVMTRFNPESHPFRALDRFFDSAANDRLYRRDGSKAQIEPLLKPQFNESINAATDLPF